MLSANAKDIQRIFAQKMAVYYATEIDGETLTTKLAPMVPCFSDAGKMCAPIEAMQVHDKNVTIGIMRITYSKLASVFVFLIPYRY